MVVIHLSIGESCPNQYFDINPIGISNFYFFTIFFIAPDFITS